ncbi:Hypothetical predicted protein [Mytilus galloprovincialis]|uniref:C1q domain-containing protein n=1 Tax=Mytilus galloprovincialis TaxID=29158 RepID=A0A8B6DQU8_MYTGA|nr:Hypothetical predicted protein [Mytilus galloprovincialis]
MYRLGFCFACVLSFSGAFLLDSSTSLPPRNVQLMTDDHYETLFRLFLDERKNRMQLQQYMEAKLDQLVKQCNSCHSVSLKPQVTKPTNETEELAAKYQQLTLEFESMQLKFEQELATSQNKTSILEQEVRNLKHVKSIDQLQTLNNVNQQVQTMKADVQSLAVSNQARSQDLISLYSDLNAYKQRITVLESNAISLENNQSLIEADFTILVDNTKKTLQAHINNNTQLIQENDEYIGLTAFGAAGYVTKSYDYQLKFPVIKSSIGISNLTSMKNTGTFICEKEGLYLITVTVMACSTGDRSFNILKNYQTFMSFYIGRSVQHDCHSGTGTAVVELYVNDTLNVRSEECPYYTKSDHPSYRCANKPSRQNQAARHANVIDTTVLHIQQQIVPTPKSYAIGAE